MNTIFSDAPVLAQQSNVAALLGGIIDITLDEEVRYTGGGGAIPDAGGPAMPFSDTINVAYDFEIADVTVGIDLSHTWVGDLIADVDNVSTVVNLFDRVGRLAGVPAFGDSSDLINGGYNFNDGFGGDLWAAAAVFDPVPIGDYFPTGLDNTASFLSDFDGQMSAGDWTLTISDNAGADLGTVDSWTLDLLPVANASGFLFGTPGDDVLRGGATNQTINGNLGDDILFGGAGDDKVNGGLGHDILMGGIGNDFLNGGAGYDTLVGVGNTLGVGEIDRLTGGGNADLFVLGDEDDVYYLGGGNSDYAYITDFSSGIDTIQLNGVFADYTFAPVFVDNIFGQGIFNGGDLVAVIQQGAANPGDLVFV
jgi:Ca2+-binding RTX toxin-like protein